VFIPVENILKSVNLGLYALFHVLILQYRGRE